MTKPMGQNGAPALCRNCGSKMAVRQRMRLGKPQNYHLCLQCNHGKGHHGPSESEIIRSQQATLMILDLEDRLARGDYLNRGEADEIRRRIAAISKAIVV